MKRLSHFGGYSLIFALFCLVAPCAASAHTGPIRVACVGASITFGYGLGPGETYPEQLQNILGDKWQVRNFGVSGRTLSRKGDSPYWKDPAFQDAQHFNPNVVVILLGTNDAKANNWAHHDEFKADCEAFVATFRNLPSKPHVFICLLPPVIEPGNLGIVPEHVTAWTPVFKQVASEEHEQIIDMYSPLAGQPQLFQDRVHPTPAGALILARTAAAALTKEWKRL